MPEEHTIQNSNDVASPEYGSLPRRSDVPFFLIMGGLSASFILLIVLLLAADLMFTSFADFKAAIFKPEIQAAFKLTLISC